MRSTITLGAVLTLAALAPAACGTTPDGSAFPQPSTSDATVPPPSDGFNIQPSDGGMTNPVDGLPFQDIETATMRIEPANATLDVVLGQSATKAFRVFGRLVGASTEIELTSRVVFYVPDRFLVGGFPLDGSPVFSTRLPASAADPPQRGGRVTIEASAANSNGIVKTTTQLTVNVSATLTGSSNVPTNAPSKFTAPSTPSRAPVLAYPNDGAMLPPNLRRLSVHWRQGSAQNTLFEITFRSEVATLAYYTRCEGGPRFASGTCGFELDDAGYALLAGSNQGTGPVKLRVRGTDDAGTAVGESEELSIEFAENRVEGGLYYWTVTTPEAIARFDFGAASGAPENYVVRGQNGIPATCPGCHALSRDGKKLVASVGGQEDGRLIFLGDLSKPKTDPSWLTVSPTSTEGRANRVQFASWNPSSSQFVAVYGDYTPRLSGTTAADNRKLWFHNGTTGLRVGHKQLAYKPNHPDWSPNGQMIAYTHVGTESTTTQRPKDSSIEILTAQTGGWSDPVTIVPPASGLNRYTPNFAPDSSFLYFTESSCALSAGPNDNSGSRCDADSDWTARTFAVQPNPLATPVFLANANRAGVADGTTTTLGDTFPRSAPFITNHRGGKLLWFTVASRRKIGLRTTSAAQLLWMFAVDPAKVLAGQDGSYPGFYLPFQDLDTSNHIAQWTEKVVGSTQPPPAPPPPPPPPPLPPPGPR
jgi:dipeptidyl aminopeptidase/acylaminoacyl peptidase